MKVERRLSGPRRRTGAAAAEFALVIPVLLLIALACVDFGRFAYHHIAVTNATRAGAEYGITHPYLSAGSSAWQTAIQTTARAELTNQTDCTPANLTTTTTVILENNGRRRIRVVGTYSSFNTIVSWPGIPNSTDLTATVEMWAIR